MGYVAVAWPCSLFVSYRKAIDPLFVAAHNSKNRKVVGSGEGDKGPSVFSCQGFSGQETGGPFF